jgi:protein-arginine kinase
MCNLGIKEKDIVEDYEKILKNLQDIEVESAKMLDVGNHDEIMDKSLRSLAILKGAYLLTSSELNSLLTNIRTGVNLQMLEVDANKINKIQILAYNKNLEFTSQSELKKLAEKVQEILKGE